MLAVAFFAFLAVLALTPLIRKLALVTGYVDHPDARKIHARTTPLLGGVAIAAALALALGFGTIRGTERIAPPSWALLAGALGALALGLYDDRRPLGPWAKLLAQLAVGASLVGWGTDVPTLRENPLLGALAAIGVVALMNAVNFLDNMDGILGAIVPVSAGAFAALAVIHGASVNLGLASALIGACVGFLAYNAPPARIFLGDAGSHLLGFALAALALQSLESSFTAPHLASVLVILAYPIFDFLFVVTDRISGGRAFYVGSTDHTTHRLGRHFGKWGTLAIVTLASSVNALLGVWLWNRMDWGSIAALLCASALAYAFLGGFLRHISPTPQFDT